MTEKYYEVDLPYYKQGDDLHAALKTVTDAGHEGAEAHAAAFAAHADCLEYGAQMLRRLAGLAIEQALRIDSADTHHITVVADDSIGEHWVREGLLHPDPFDSEIFDEEGLVDDVPDEEWDGADEVVAAAAHTEFLDTDRPI